MATQEAMEKSQRATWKVYEEFDLLEKYTEARKNPSLKTDKRHTSTDWQALTNELNLKHKRTLEKAQYKAKFNRLMRDYDLYKEIVSLCGAGICIPTGKPMLDDDVWDRLVKVKPKAQTGKIKEIRTKGFEHAIICSMAAGDEAQSVGSIAKQLGTPDNADGDSMNVEEVLLASKSTMEGASVDISDSEQVSVVPDPPSQRQRIANIKRIRDGASKGRHGMKKSRKRYYSEDSMEDVKELVKVVNDYLAYKVQQEMHVAEHTEPDSIIFDQLTGDYNFQADV